MKAAVITVSDRSYKGDYLDTSGEILQVGLREFDYEIVEYIVVPDSLTEISNALQNAIMKNIDLIVTTGGTGISIKDVTPEATRPFIQKELPGFSESFRAFSRTEVATTDLSRGLAGINGNSLIINLPGSPSAVKDGLVIIKRLAKHIHDQLAGHDHIKSN